MATKKIARKAPTPALANEVTKSAKAEPSNPKEKATKPAAKDKEKKTGKASAKARTEKSEKTGKVEKAVKAAEKTGDTKEKTASSNKSASGQKSQARSKSPGKTKSLSKIDKPGADAGTAKVLDSQVVYQGPLFRVLRDRIIEPGGQESSRDVIRHNGSVVILAVKPAKEKKDPWVLIERQYRHAAGQFLWELPAGKLDAGEQPVDGARRELAEETGYSARKWTPLVEYFASPGFLGEAMKVFLAEDLAAGEAHPEEDERIDFHLVKLSELLAMIDKGKIIDGKTLTSVLLYARKLGLKRKK